MTGTFTVGLIQNTAEREMAPNIAHLTDMIAEAADLGADLIAMPEMCTMLEPRDGDIYAKCHSEADDPGLAKFRELAKRHARWILAGSILIRGDQADKVVNRSFLIDAKGEIAARYDKLHMFDVKLRNGELYQESATVAPGGRAVIAETPWTRLGMSVCYDLRFGYLYRALAKAGAEVLAVPAAFTRTTGMAHWHTLVRARAIETGSFVIAPNQCGTHAEGRRTYGHSLVVAPWGEVLADAGPEPGVIIAKIDLAKVGEARAMIPSLGHDRPFEGPVQATAAAAE